MKNALIASLFSLLFFLLLFTANAESIEKGMWVWGKSTDIILERNRSDRSDFFSFVQAPHGKQETKISTVFMSIDPDVVRNKPQKVREFIADAHSRGLNVQLLAGEKEWGLTMINPSTNMPYNQGGIDLINIVINYHSNSRPEEKFDAIHYDVEPHTISETDEIVDVNGKIYIGEDDWDLIFPQYLNSMQQFKNLCSANGIKFGVDIARFYGTQIQDIVDFIAVMDYTIRTESALTSALEKLIYADENGYSQSVYVGLETLQVTWKEKPESESHFNNYNNVYMVSTSFWIKGNQELENLVNTMYWEFANPFDPTKKYDSFRGVAIHYYENIDNGETAYRNLDLIPYNHAPVCFLVSPAGNEMFNSNGFDIKYRVIDQDNDLLNVKIKISFDNGLSWTTLRESTIAPAPEYYGNYYVNLSEYNPGNQYKVRIEAQEIKDTGALYGFDQSDFSFSIKTGEFVKPLIDKDNISIEIDNEAYPTKRFPIKWSDFSAQKDKIKGYYYSLYSKLYPEKASYTRSTWGYLDSEIDGNIKIYIWADFLDGSSSDEITMSVKIYSDLDNDKKADLIDPDIDGDGISNVDELTAGTNENDKLNFDTANIIGLWQFNGNLNNSVGTDNLTVTSGLNNLIYNNMSAELYFGKTANPTKFSFDSDITPGQTKALSVHMWIKPATVVIDNILYVPLFFDGDINGGLSLLFKNDAKSLSFRYYVPGKAGVFQSLDYNNTSLLNGQWHHVAFTFNGIDGIIQLYVDGKLVGQRVAKSIVPYESAKKSRFFDAESDFDSDNSTLLGIRPNSAQFEHNYFDDYPEGYDPFVSCYYFGFVDDIKIFSAVVAPDYDYDGLADDIDIDSDGDGIDDSIDTYPFDTDNNGIMNFSQNDIDGDGTDDLSDSFPFNNLYKTDSDLDGIADEYEIDSVGNKINLNPNDDFDNDGKTNLEEFIAGTKYDDPDSVLKINNVYMQVDNDGNQIPSFNVSFYTQPGVQYVFEAKSRALSKSFFVPDFYRQVIGNGELYTIENIDIENMAAGIGRIRVCPNKKLKF